MKRIISLIGLLFIFYLLYEAYDYLNINKYIINNKEEKIIEKNTNNLEIYFLDVGEGDSILITKNDKNVLIDGGNNKDGKYLVEYLKELKIDSFEYVIATHPHEDHIGGLDYVIREFNIKNYLQIDIDLDNITYQEIINELDKKNINKYIPKEDYEFSIDDLQFKILYLDNNIEDINNSSMIIRLVYKDTSYLFMADANNEEEQMILDKNIKSDVLKVGHHGSKYATSAQLIKKVLPRYSIISVGANNDYYFPHQITIDKLEKIGSIIYRTDKDHTIKLISDGESINIEMIKTNINHE